MTTKQVKPPSIPSAWAPAVWEPADASALQALHRGEANAGQQQRALKWLIDACGTYDVSYRPSSDRDTAFAEGRRFVGLQIIKLLKINVGKFTGQPSENG